MLRLVCSGLLLLSGAAFADGTPDYRNEIQSRVDQLKTYVAQATAGELRRVSVSPAPNSDGDDFELRVTIRPGQYVVIPLRDLAAVSVDRQMNLAGAILVRRIQDDRRANYRAIRAVRQNIGGTENLSLAAGRYFAGGGLTFGGGQGAISIYQVIGGFQIEEDNAAPAGAASRQWTRRVARLDITYEAGLGSESGPDVGASALRVNLSAFELSLNVNGQSEVRDDARVWIRPGVFRYSLADYDNTVSGIANRTRNRIDIDAIEVGGSRETHITRNFQLYLAGAVSMGARVLDDDDGAFDAHVNYQAEVGFVAADLLVFRAFHQIDFAWQGALFILNGAELGFRTSAGNAPFYFAINYSHRENDEDSSRVANPYFQTPDDHSVSFTLRREFR
jgi:hypothetical protein